MSTLVSVLGFTPAPDSSTNSTPANPATATEQTSSHHRSAVLGASIGVPLGLVATTVLFFILRRRLKQKAYETAVKSAIFFPPDHIYSTDNYVIARIELDAFSNTISELDARPKPSELDGSANGIPGSKDCKAMMNELEDTTVKSELEGKTVVSELDATPKTLPDSKTRISPATTAYDSHFSAVLSSEHQPHADGMVATGTGLSIVSQRHQRTNQSYLLPPQEAQPGTLCATQSAASELTSDSRPAFIVNENKDSGANDGERGHADQENEHARNAQDSEQISSTHESEVAKEFGKAVDKILKGNGG